MPVDTAPRLAPPATVRTSRSELTYPSTSIVVLAGLPGAGKSTLLHRLYGGPPVPATAGDLRLLDSEQVRHAWQNRFGGLPYPWWRPMVHTGHYLRTARAILGTGPVLVHDCGTRPWVRQLLGRLAAVSGRELHLVLLDVPDELARSRQRGRARMVSEGAFATHRARWRRLLPGAAADPASVVPGARSAVVLDQTAAAELRAIRFDR